MIDGQDQRLQALLPICGLCSAPLHEPSSQPHLLVCGHVFCYYCLQDLTNCPFDAIRLDEQMPNQLNIAVDKALQMRYHSNRELFRQALNQLEFAYSQIKVPCKLTYINGQCPFPQCCGYDHSLQFFKKSPCPRGAGCWRGDLCLFTHAPLVNYVTETVSIRSLSLMRKIEAGFPAFLEIVARYQVQMQNLQPGEVSYYTEKKWVYEYQQSTIELDQQAQVDIQYALDHFKTFVYTSGVKVFFRPQFLITSENSVFRVACTSVCTGTSAAGVLTFVCDESWKEAFQQEIQQLECEVSGVVVGNRQLAWVKRWGLGFWNGQIIGDTQTLIQALTDRPEFDEYDDIMEIPFQFDPAMHSISGRTVEVFAGKLVGLRDDVMMVCTQTAAQLRSAPSYPAYPVNTLPAVGWAPPQPIMYQPAPQPYSQPSYQPVNVPMPRNLPAASMPPQTYQQTGNRQQGGSNGDDDMSPAQARDLVKLSLPHATIIEILPARVNSNAKQRFEAMKRALSTGGPVEIEYLFHGTKQDNPQTLASSSACLNSRKRFGLWGRGIYFYEYLHAVDSYSYVTAQGNKQTLLCEVLVGESFESQPTLFTSAPAGYNSVQGYDHRSNLWVTYDDDMAIPAYLITYVD